VRLTQYTDYGLRLLIYLAARPDFAATVREVSDAYGISRAHLNKVALQLTSAGVLASKRGRGGGVRLAGRPDCILLGTVVRLLEPDFNLVECMRPANACVITPSCRLRDICKEVQSAVLDVFDRYTLADLVHDDAQRHAICRLLGIPAEEDSLRPPL